MKHKRRTLKENMRQFPNTEASCLNPERIALDALIEISNEQGAPEIDNKILNTEECEILPSKSIELVSKFAITAK